MTSWNIITSDQRRVMNFLKHFRITYDVNQVYYSGDMGDIVILFHNGIRISAPTMMLEQDYN
jgi:hypothetical protein